MFLLRDNLRASHCQLGGLGRAMILAFTSLLIANFAVPCNSLREVLGFVFREVVSLAIFCLLFNGSCLLLTCMLLTTSCFLVIYCFQFSVFCSPLPSICVLLLGNCLLLPEDCVVLLVKCLSFSLEYFLPFLA